MQLGLLAEQRGDQGAAADFHFRGCTMGYRLSCSSLGYVYASRLRDWDADATDHELMARAEKEALVWGRLRPPVFTESSTELEARPPRGTAPEGTNTGDTLNGEREQVSLRDVLRRHNWRLEHCYERGLHVDPELQGRITLQFVVGDGGHVIETSLPENEIAEPLVGECVARSFYGVRFNEPEGGRARVRVPYILEPGR